MDNRCSCTNNNIPHLKKYYIDEEKIYFFSKQNKKYQTTKYINKKHTNNHIHRIVDKILKSNLYITYITISKGKKIKYFEGCSKIKQYLASLGNYNRAVRLQTAFLSLLCNGEKWLTKSYITKKLGWPEHLLNEAVEISENFGMDIRHHPTKGYKLKISDRSLQAHENIKGNSHFIKKVYFYRVVSSTNIAGELTASIGAPEGTVILGVVQTEGRASQGKRWDSPPGGIWMSIILRPNIPPEELHIINLVAGVSIVSALKKQYYNTAELKWPNDILLDGKKIGGILTEACTIKDKIEYAVLGIGVNTNVNKGDVPANKRGSTTLKHEERLFNEIVFLNDFFDKFNKLYTEFKKRNYNPIFSEWMKKSITIGEKLIIYPPIEEIDIIKGRGCGLSSKGYLVIEQEDGTYIDIPSGACSIEEEKNINNRPINLQKKRR